MKRSQITHFPCSSAGRIVALTWSPRAAANRIVSTSGPSGLAAPESSTWRMMSAPAEPPGSRVTTTPIASARRRSARRPAWVDLPAPSPPSKVMKRPRIPQQLGLCACPCPAGRPPEHALRREVLYPFVAGKEQADHELGRRVEGAPRDSSRRHVLGGVKRHLQHHILAAPDLEGADCLTLGHRRPHRAAVDDARQELLGRSARNQQV